MQIRDTLSLSTSVLGQFALLIYSVHPSYSNLALLLAGDGHLTELCIVQHNTIHIVALFHSKPGPSAPKSAQRWRCGVKEADVYRWLRMVALQSTRLA